MPRSLLLPTAVAALALLGCNKPEPAPAGAAPVTESAAADSAATDSVAVTTDSAATSADTTMTPAPADTTVPTDSAKSN
jgi:hypothetical protein